MEPQWKVHTPNLLGEVFNNDHVAILQKPMTIFALLLDAVAKRASELNDPELNALMMRLTLYSVADPASPDYDSVFVNKYLSNQSIPIR